MNSAPAYWVHNLPPFLIEFGKGFGIRYYGLAYVLGFVSCAWLLGRYAAVGRSQLPKERLGDFMVALMLGVILGGRVGYFFLYDGWRDFSEDPLALLRVWQGGMSFHGGLAGVGIAVFFFARRSQLPYLHLFDLISTIYPIGHLFGRIANFINGELWGRPTNVKWAVIFPQAELPGLSPALMTPRHPSQLYEAVLEGLVLIILFQWRFLKTQVSLLKPGRITGEFLIAYALMRMVCELFREPDRGIDLLFGLSRGTFYSLFMVAAGALLIFVVEQRRGNPGKEGN